MPRGSAFVCAPGRGWKRPPPQLEQDSRSALSKRPFCAFETAVLRFRNGRSDSRGQTEGGRARPPEAGRCGGPGGRGSPGRDKPGQCALGALHTPQKKSNFVVSVSTPPPRRRPKSRASESRAPSSLEGYAERSRDYLTGVNPPTPQGG